MTEWKVQIRTSSFLLSQQLLSDNQQQLFHYTGRCTQTPFVRENSPPPKHEESFRARLLALDSEYGWGQKVMSRTQAKGTQPCPGRVPAPTKSLLKLWSSLHPSGIPSQLLSQHLNPGDGISWFLNWYHFCGDRVERSSATFWNLLFFFFFLWMIIDQNIEMSVTVFFMLKCSSSDFRSKEGFSAKEPSGCGHKPLRAEAESWAHLQGTRYGLIHATLLWNALLRTFFFLCCAEFQVSPTFENTRYQPPSLFSTPFPFLPGLPPATFWLREHLNSNPAPVRLVMGNQDGALMGTIHACGKIQEVTRKIQVSRSSVMHF